MIGLFIVTVGVLALLTELVTYIQGQVHDKHQATAMRLATTALEDARHLPYNSLASLAGSTTTTPRSGYTQITSVQICSASDAEAACTSPGSGASTARVSVTITWQDGTAQRQFALTSAVSDTSTRTDSSAGSGTLSGLTGGSSSGGTSVVLGNLTFSPSTVTVDSSGTPLNNVVVSFTATGLSTSTTLPLTWTDDTGSHQATMTSSGATTWSVTVPSSSITKAVPSSSSQAHVTFAATVPGGGVATNQLTVVPRPAFTGSCTVLPNPIVFQVLTKKTAFAEALTCTTTGLSASDTVGVSYPTGTTTTATGTLSSSDGGTTWRLTLPVGTTLKGAPSETFTFSCTRVSDGLAGTPQSVTVLAA
jgi:hypothetical protein